MSKSNLFFTRKRWWNHGYCKQHVSFSVSLYCFWGPWTGRSPWTTLGWLSTWWRIKPETLVIEISSTRTLFKIVLRIPDRTNDSLKSPIKYVKETFITWRSNNFFFQTIGSKRRWNSNIRIHHWLRCYCWSQRTKFFRLKVSALNLIMRLSDGWWIW